MYEHTPPSLPINKLIPKGERNMNNELPNLSTWHRVPVSATIPANTPYAYTYVGGLHVELDGYFRDTQVKDNNADYTYYTEHLITPPLPTEEGATILMSNDEHPLRFLLTRKGGCWVTCFGDQRAVDDITAWAPVSIGETVVMPRATKLHCN